MPNTYTPNYNIANGYVPYTGNPATDTPVSSDDLNLRANILDSQVPASLRMQGRGVAPEWGGKMLVTAGSGLSVSIASGAVNVGTDARPVGAYLPNSYPIAGLEANRSNANPLYLHVFEDDGVATQSGNKTVETGVPAFEVSYFASIPNYVLLATITTGANSVTSVTANPNRFIKGGTGGGSPLTVIDGTGAEQENVAELTFTHLTFDEDGNLASFQFFDADDTIPSTVPVAVVAKAAPGPDLIQVTVGADYTMNGSEDRVDVDTTNGVVMITLPANPSLYHEKPRFTIANIGSNPANMAHVQPNTGASFALSNTPIDLAPEDALEVYASKRLNNTYIWSKI